MKPRALRWCHSQGREGFVEGPRGAGSSSLGVGVKILLLLHLPSLGVTREGVDFSNPQKDCDHNLLLLSNSGTDTA